MQTFLPLLGRLFSIPFEASLLRGGRAFGHFRHGAGIMFGGKMLELALAGIVALACAAMVTTGVSDWVEKRYGNSDYARVAGWGAFLVVAIVLGAGIARFL